MKNKQLQILYFRSVVAILFIIWGIGWLVPASQNSLKELPGGLFIILGIGFLYYSVKGIRKYRRTGEVKAFIDERAELNGLKGSRNGYMVIVFSLSVLYVLLELGLISANAFAAFTGTVVAAGIITHILSYYIYERKG